MKLLNPYIWQSQSPSTRTHHPPTPIDAVVSNLNCPEGINSAQLALIDAAERLVILFSGFASRQL